MTLIKCDCNWVIRVQNKLYKITRIQDRLTEGLIHTVKLPVGESVYFPERLSVTVVKK